MTKLNKLLAKLEDLHPKYIDLSLKRINRLLFDLGNPHLELPKCIHIAGTNGKGSTLNFIKTIMIESNYKVHAYISPHLEKINERFIIANNEISDRKLYENLKYISKINNNKPITFYEITTALAFYLFNKNKADFLLLETGLGGRLDATNIIKESLISIITPIGFDHQEYLGNTLKKITEEKLGIIKKSSVLISSKQNYNIQKQISLFAKINNNKSLIYGKEWSINKTKNKFFLFKTTRNTFKFRKPKLLGDFQIYNCSTALATIYYLKKIGFKFDYNKINKGIQKSFWPGRLQLVQSKNPKIFLDGSHNVDGAKSLKEFIKNSKKKTWLILGMLNSKDISSYLKILKNNVIGIIAIKIPYEINSYTPHEIEKCCKKLKIFCKKESNSNIAITNLINDEKPKQIIITGSLYLVGQIKRKLNY